MKKLSSLRQFLEAAVPSLKSAPDRLHIYIEKGRIACGHGSLSYQYHYEANIVVTDFSDHADTLIVPLLAWVSTHQPDLLINSDSADNVIRFEAEIIDSERTDVLLILDLSERVIVRETMGRYTATHCDEPALPDAGGAAPWALYVAGAPIESP